MPNVQSIAQLWEGYAELVLPPGCPEVQRAETRQAFYSGVIAAVSTVARAFHEDKLSEADVAASLRAWRDEIERYVKQISIPRG